MNVLALHFGHDSAISFIAAGRIIGCQLSERVMQKKLFIGVNSELIIRFFKAYSIRIEDVDCVALTSTQREDLYIEDGGILDIEYRRHQDDHVPSLIEAYLEERRLRPVDFFLGNDAKEKELRLRRLLVPHAIDPRYRAEAVAFKYLPWMDFATVRHPSPYTSLDGIVDELGDPWVDISGGEYGFHFPATATLLGKRMPCYLINHHAAHAASTYYLSGSRNGAVITADGGAGGMRGGWFFHGHWKRLSPIAPHHLEIGGLYSQTSRSIIKLGSSPDGKMMGLAPYGTPTLFSEEHVGNAWSFDQLAKEQRFPSAHEKRYAWHEHLLGKAKEHGYDMDALGDPERVLEPVNVDIAATLQKLFEETLLKTATSLQRLLTARGLDADTLCLAGGCMLNCPSNSNLYDRKVFSDVFVPPFTDDSGCAIGAGLWAYYNFFDGAEIKGTKAFPVTPYLGNPVSEVECVKALERAEGLVFSRPADPAAAAAADLMEDRIVAFFDGRSEIGPRALGHRTLMADPRKAENWPRVNRVKTRALWRPFSPAILRDHLREYFDGGPDNSPYMLFNATAKNRALPAVTHVDGTSRVQTVTIENGAFYDVIAAFQRLSGCPVVLNTSFNGPGEPIIETPAQALGFLRSAPREVILYLSGSRVQRAD